MWNIHLNTLFDFKMILKSEKCIWLNNNYTKWGGALDHLFGLNLHVEVACENNKQWSLMICKTKRRSQPCKNQKWKQVQKARKMDCSAAGRNGCSEGNRKKDCFGQPFLAGKPSCFVIFVIVLQATITLAWHFGMAKHEDHKANAKWMASVSLATSISIGTILVTVLRILLTNGFTVASSMYCAIPDTLQVIRSLSAGLKTADLTLITKVFTYVQLTWVLWLWPYSATLQKEFPSFTCLKQQGIIMTDGEKTILDKTYKKLKVKNGLRDGMLPIVVNGWFQKLIKDCARSFRDPDSILRLLEGLSDDCGKLVKQIQSKIMYIELFKITNFMAHVCGVFAILGSGLFSDLYPNDSAFAISWACLVPNAQAVHSFSYLLSVALIKSARSAFDPFSDGGPLINLPYSKSRKTNSSFISKRWNWPRRPHHHRNLRLRRPHHRRNYRTRRLHHRRNRRTRPPNHRQTRRKVIRSWRGRPTSLLIRTRLSRLINGINVKRKSRKSSRSLIPKGLL